MKTVPVALFVIFCYNSLFCQATSEIAVREFTLQNGLKVFLNEDPDANTVLGAVVINAGSKQDPKEATGIAHYLEHMLFKGTDELGTTDFEKESIYLDSIEVLYERLASASSEREQMALRQTINNLAVKAAEYALPSEFGSLLKKMGSTGVNAFTNKDYTVFQNAFPPQYIIKWLHLYSHRFLNPVFRNFQAELEVVYEEKNSIMDSEEYWFNEEVNLALFGENGYGFAHTIGRAEHLKNPSLKKMREFYQTYYVANNMALILCGKFDSEAIIPVIEATFGKLPSGMVPQFNCPRQSFSGRETHHSRIFSYETEVIAFKAHPDNLKERAALQVGLNILDNSTKTGLLDSLEEQNLVHWFRISPLLFADDGAVYFRYPPKKSKGKIERIILENIEKVKAGAYDETLLTISRNEYEIWIKTMLENIAGRALLLSEAYLNQISWREYQNYLTSLSSIDKTDIQKVFKKVFGDDYLVMHFWARERPLNIVKIPKPSLQPVTTRQEGRSTYAATFDSLEETQIAPRFLKFRDDIQAQRLSGNNILFWTPNKVNDIFSLTIKYHVGKTTIKDLSEASDLLNYCGTEYRSRGEFKREMARLGGRFYVSGGLNYLTVYISGFEKNAGQIIELANEMLQYPKPEKRSMKDLVSDVRQSRDSEANTPMEKSDLLYEFGVYGPYSSYLFRKPVSDIERMDPDDMLDSLKKAYHYAANIHYTGSLPADSVAVLIDKRYHLEPVVNKEPHFVKLAIEPEETTVLYFPVADALQTQIRLYIPGKICRREDFPLIDAFNAYFGQGSTGIVFQEVREYRSLAYSSYGYYEKPSVPGYRGNLFLSANCQADKTMETLAVLQDLIEELPAYPERMENIRNYLWNQSFSNYPSFRFISQTVEIYARMGYTGDPNQLALASYGKLTFEDLQQFYDQHIRGRPYRLMVTGPYDKDLIQALKDEFGAVSVFFENDLRAY